MHDLTTTIPVEPRAPRGGQTQFLTGRFYRGGEFMPFYVPREVMPQVDERDYDRLFQFLFDSHGIAIRREQVTPQSIRPHQRVDMERMRDLEKQPDVLAKAVLISRDNYILDGHHRWGTHLVKGMERITAYRLDADFEDAISALCSFDGVWTTLHHPIED